VERILEPEWLDLLPPSDRRARRSRADLRRINWLMRNAAHVAKPLRQPALGRPLRVADLGAGDGSFMRSVQARLERRLEVVPVDRILGEDAEEFLERSGAAFDAIVANLFLHHFEPGPLRRLLALAARRTNLFVACEPRRSALALQASRLALLLGCNDVTRHDAVASVRAGFCGDELSRAWPREGGWQLAERAALPFSHLFVARRNEAL
jgi:hypothetical protein